MNTDYYVPNLYSFGTDGSRLSINALPECTDTLCSIPLGIQINIDGYVVFRLLDINWEPAGDEIILKDLITGSEKEISDKNTYVTYLKAGEYKNRFVLNIHTLTTGLPEVIPDKELFSVYFSAGKLYVSLDAGRTGSGTLTLLNLTGQTIFANRISESGSIDPGFGIKDGIYLVTFSSKSFRFSRKIYIKNR